MHRRKKNHHHPAFPIINLGSVHARARAFITSETFPALEAITKASRALFFLRVLHYHPSEFALVIIFRSRLPLFRSRGLFNFGLTRRARMREEEENYNYERKLVGYKWGVSRL